MSENITYYYIDPAERDHKAETIPFADALDSFIARMVEPEVRWPVRNREERREISDHKRALIYARDDMTCHVCGEGNAHVLDHIIPRSAFRAEDLHIADRSDNLACSHWGCNEKKSNYRRPTRKRLGVVQQCGDCVRGYGRASDPERWEEENESCADYWGVDPDDVLPVYCRSCGYMGRVPGVEWVM